MADTVSAPNGLQTPTAGHDPHATHDLHYHNTHHRGFDQFMALAQHGRPSPARVAELLVQHPKDQARIFTYLHQHKGLGNHYVNEVKHAMKHAVDAQHVNLDMRQLNHDHQGTGSTGSDPNRLELYNAQFPGGVLAKFASATKVYMNDGNAYPIGEAPAGQQVKLNTGGAKMMTLSDLNPGHPTEMVMGFYIGPDNARVTGWVPKESLDDVGKHLAQIDHTIANKIADKHKGIKFAHAAKKVKATGRPPVFEDLRTGANQGDSANLPEHYYARPGNVVNLLSNVPNTGDKKFGVALDVLVEGTEFFEATPRMSDHVQMWKKASHTLTDQVITFVYGKAQHGSQPPSYGWINAACLH